MTNMKYKFKLADFLAAFSPVHDLNTVNFFPFHFLLFLLLRFHNNKHNKQKIQQNHFSLVAFFAVVSNQKTSAAKKIK